MYIALFPVEKGGRRVKLASHLNLMMKSRMTEILLSFNMTSCRAHKLFDPGIFSSLKNSGRFWNPPSLLLNWYRHSVPGVKQAGRDVDHSPRLRMTGAIPVFRLHVFVRWTEQLYRLLF